MINQYRHKSISFFLLNFCLLILIIYCFSLQSEEAREKDFSYTPNSIQEAEWQSPKFSDTKSVLNHIFRDEEGHFHEDSIENRAYILEAVSSPSNRAAINNYGTEIYFKTMLDGTQAWAYVEKGIIKNGGYNKSPMTWIPDSSSIGGALVPEEDHSNSKPKNFRENANSNELLRQNKSGYKGRSNMGSSLGGIGHCEGIIRNLFGKGAKEEGEHIFFFPTSEGFSLTEEQVQRMLRELAIGIFIYEENPFFSLHFRKDLKQYPVIHPAYEKTFVGYVISMLDYYMKGFVNGGFFRDGFLEEWVQNPSMSESLFLENSLNFRDYCMQELGEPYLSFDEILLQLEKESGERHNLPNFQDYVKKFRAIAKQNAIKKVDDLFLIDADFEILYDISPLPEKKEEYALYHRLDRACQIMCEQIKRIMPRLPKCKKLFEAFRLMNFFMYYYNTLKTKDKIPYLTPKFFPIDHQVCPHIFPPYPNKLYSLQQELEIGLLSLTRSLPSDEQLLLLASIQNWNNPIEKNVILHFAEALKKNAIHSLAPSDSSYWQGLAASLLDAFRKRYKATHQCVETSLLTLGIANISEKEIHVQIQELLSLANNDLSRLENEKFKIKDVDTLENLKQRKQFLKEDIELLKNLQKWFQDPIASILGEAVAVINFATNRIAINLEPSKGTISIAGGCSMCIDDQIAKTDPSGYALLKNYSSLLEDLPCEKLLPISNGAEYSQGVLFKLEFGSVFDLCMPIDNPDKKDLAGGYFYVANPKYPRTDASSHAFHAIATGDEALFRRVAANVPHWNYQDRTGRTFLHYAARSKNPYFLEYILQQGASLDGRDPLGYTALHYAAEEGNQTGLNRLIELAPHLINAASDGGMTPLQSAALYNQLPCVQLLLEAKANPNCEVLYEFTPLLSAIYHKYEEIALELLKSDLIDIEYARADNTRAIHWAVQMQLEKVVQKLIAKGAQVDVAIKGSRYRPLHFAAEAGWLPGVEMLMRCKPYIDIEAKTASGKTPMGLAMDHCHMEVSEFLWQNGAIPQLCEVLDPSYP